MSKSIRLRIIEAELSAANAKLDHALVVLNFVVSSVTKLVAALPPAPAAVTGIAAEHGNPPVPLH